MGTVGLQEEESTAGVSVQAFFELSSPLAELRRQFEQLASRAGLRLVAPSWSIEQDRSDEWLQSFRRSFTAFDIGGSYHIHPSWEPPSERRPINILMEPGHAFGTGTHESTQLCLLALEGTLPLSGRLLDIGTGSGILAIAAAKLTTGLSVFAMDNDPLAVAMARENFDRNHVWAGGLFVGELTGIRGRFDWVIANLTMEIFRQTAPEIMRLAADNLLLSGFTTEQTPIVAGFFESGQTFKTTAQTTLNGWQSLLLRAHHG